MSTTTVSDATYTGSNANIDSLFWGGAWDTPGSGTTIIEYSLRFGSDPYSFFSGINYGNSWSAIETTAIETAFGMWEAVADIDFQETLYYDDSEIWYWQGSDFEVGGLGWHEVPDSAGIEPLYGVFSYEGLGWDAGGLQAGGYGYLTLLHEIGHGLGLAHPHDNGGDSSIMPGVFSEYDFGTYDLNQGVWTVMTYNDGWMSEYPNHTIFNGYSDYDYSATPMALDIAAIQEIYGANTAHAAGDDTYVIPSANGAGTYWSSLWDAGGYDVISAEGSSRAYTIDLREAPLTGANAGGYMNYSSGIVGGFTVANGVVIEEGVGGSGNDTITGHNNGSTLRGGGGNDLITGGSANDTIEGGNGSDTLNGGGGEDEFLGGAGGDAYDGGDAFDTITYGADSGRILLDLQSDVSGSGFAVFYDGGASSGDTFTSIEGATGDVHADNLRGDSNANMFSGGASSDRLYGRAGDDILYGDGGADALYGNTGADYMVGGGGAVRDRFIYFNMTETGVGSGNRDRIDDFQSGTDRIEISRFDADTTQGFKQGFDFVGSAGFSSTAGELRYQVSGSSAIVQGDVDGDGSADFEIELLNVSSLIEADFLI